MLLKITASLFNYFVNPTHAFLLWVLQNISLSSLSNSSFNFFAQPTNFKLSGIHNTFIPVISCPPAKLNQYFTSRKMPIPFYYPSPSQIRQTHSMQIEISIILSCISFPKCTSFFPPILWSQYFRSMRQSSFTHTYIFSYTFSKIVPFIHSEYWF